MQYYQVGDFDVLLLRRKRKYPTYLCHKALTPEGEGKYIKYFAHRVRICEDTNPGGLPAMVSPPSRITG